MLYYGGWASGMSYIRIMMFLRGDLCHDSDSEYEYVCELHTESGILRIELLAVKLIRSDRHSCRLPA